MQAEVLSFIGLRQVELDLEMKNRMESSHPKSFDALFPLEMAERADRIGVERTRRHNLSLLAPAVWAGAFIAFGAMFSTIATVGADDVLPFGVIRLLAGLTFSLGLILVIVGGPELFTGNNLMVMAYDAGKVPAGEVARAWGIVYIGKLAGALGVALLIFAASGYGTRAVADKILAIVPPISAFAAAGFEHSVANAYLLPFAILIKNGAPDAFWSATGKTARVHPGLTFFDALTNLVMVIAGNLPGGVLVGIAYWFIYLRKRGSQ